jgi:hypothetical protein
VVNQMGTSDAVAEMLEVAREKAANELLRIFDDHLREGSLVVAGVALGALDSLRSGEYETLVEELETLEIALSVDHEDGLPATATTGNERAH